MVSEFRAKMKVHQGQINQWLSPCISIYKTNIGSVYNWLLHVSYCFQAFDIKIILESQQARKCICFTHKKTKAEGDEVTCQSHTDTSW